MGTHPIFESDFDCLTESSDFNMQNDKGEIVDLYIPRKCSASNRLIGAKDKSSIQINFCDVDPATGRMLSTNQTFAICGAIRRMGQSDDSLYRLARETFGQINVALTSYKHVIPEIKKVNDVKK